MHNYVYHSMLLHMRTTIIFNDELMKKAKLRAAEEDTSLRNVMEAALRSYLQSSKSQKQKYRLRWKSERGRILPGVVLDDRDALFDLMEGRR